jgi:hypothetical protein
MADDYTQDVATEDLPTPEEFAGVVSLMQAELVELELWRIRRQMFADPAVSKINVGAGQLTEQTLTGNRQDPYNGVAIFNPTPATLSVGFESGLAWLAPLMLPPYSYAKFPERFTNLSIATLIPADQQQAIAAPVTVMRLRVPPEPAAGAYGNAEPIASLVAQSTNQAGATLDNGAARASHTLQVVAGAGVSAGAVQLQASLDGVNFVNLGAAVATAAPGVFSLSSAGTPFRYVRAAITTPITGGTITATVASA